MDKLEKKLYPTEAELQEQADCLSQLSEESYQKFVRQGIPAAVASKIKRRHSSKKTKQRSGGDVC